LVLGCTHYPFVQKQIEACIHGTTTRPITIIDTGDAVARQLKRLLVQHGIERDLRHEGTLQNFTTGDAAAFASAFATLLGMQAQVTHIELEHQQSQA
jgi:glutamate racemase